MLIRKVLIANRGEIAARIIRTAKRLGMATVAVYSEADAESFHLREADERVLIGPADARHSYLKIDNILAAVEQTGADAVHPGYGFLSENPLFAAACRNAGLNFIGPPTEAIASMGNKTAARRIALSADVPLLPGSDVLETVQDAKVAAARIGYPVLIKPAGGGGGIGMQKAADETQLVKHFEACQSKAARFFGDGKLYLEKYLEAPRHVEMQIAADSHGNFIHLGERECSIQRRHQKVMEETPSPAVTPEMRKLMAGAALRLTRRVGYASLGTVEMLVQGQDFYFLEMNTRLQVEHTVTEMVTGLDLVEWQMHIAMGERLPASQPEIQFAGHAFECRVYAENPEKGFFPSPGKISRFDVPGGEGVRNDVGVAAGDTVTPYYDPMLAKLVVHGADRGRALERLRAALQNYWVEGIATNLAMHRQVVDCPAFVEGKLSTHFLREHLGFKV